MAKSIIVLVIDHDTYEDEVHDKSKLTAEDLLELGHSVNEDAANILGYECWETVFEVNPDTLAQIHAAGSSNKDN